MSFYIHMYTYIRIFEPTCESFVKNFISIVCFKHSGRQADEQAGRRAGNLAASQDGILGYIAIADALLIHQLITKSIALL